ncbi:MAG: tRNA epoxyqueuosine(34) reductase QueG [Planctomycetaceae bacterium]
MLNDTELAANLKAKARELGFELVGITPAVTPLGVSALKEWLERGFAGEMHYIERRLDAYANPSRVLVGVKSIVILATNYRTVEPPPVDATSGRVARYAWGGGDYHDLLRERMQPLTALLHEARPQARTRMVVDTAPLLERDFARMAGLGWFGKNTMLIHRRAGSWLLLSAILTDISLPPDAPHETSHCGTCTRCLDACPTDAFVEPFVLDATRCISYLTIELRGTSIPEPLRDGMGEWVFGCDVCQEVCPWNRKSPLSNDPAFLPQSGLDRLELPSLFALSEAEFQQRFSGTPLERSGRVGLLQNAAIRLGNSNDPAALPPLRIGLNDPSPIVREAVLWAITKIESTESPTS